MTAAKKEIDGDTEMEAEDDSDGGEAEMPVDATVDERKQIYVLNLVDAGYDETLAIRSLQYVDPEDVTAGENNHSYLRNWMWICKHFNIKSSFLQLRLSFELGGPSMFSVYKIRNTSLSIIINSINWKFEY